MTSIRQFTPVLVLAACGICGLPNAPALGQSPPCDNSVLVVTSPHVETYAWAVDEIRSRVGRAKATVRLIENDDRLREQLSRGAPCLAVAVGSEAARRLWLTPTRAPMILSMILEAGFDSDKAALRKRSLRVLPLDVPASRVFFYLKRLFPGKNRIGVIRNPNRGDPTAASLKEQGRGAGMAVEVAECAGAADLVNVFNRFIGTVDFVWTFPDSSLYNATTIRPLVISSLNNRLPIVGFSEAFAKSGAALAIYPDYRAIGVETGEMAARFVRGLPLGDSKPVPTQVALNQNVLRMIGIRVSLKPEDQEVFVLP